MGENPLALKLAAEKRPGGGRGAGGMDGLVHGSSKPN